jgi:hypothetical protein
MTASDEMLSASAATGRKLNGFERGATILVSVHRDVRDACDSCQLVIASTIIGRRNSICRIVHDNNTMSKILKRGTSSAPFWLQAFMHLDHRGIFHLPFYYSIFQVPWPGTWRHGMTISQLRFGFAW